MPTQEIPNLMPYQNMCLINLEGEMWHPVGGFEGLYMVSNLGRVKALKVKKKRGRFFHLRPETILKQKIATRGYCHVTLSNNKISKTMLVHRLVALAFILNPKNKPTVNHENGNKSDNRAGNLQWATQYEQIHHAIDSGLADNSGEKCANAKLKTKDVLYIRSSKSPIRGLCYKYGVSESTILRILKRETWKKV